jgi:hypothetical protein
MSVAVADPFASPSAGVKITEYKGRLMLVTPLEYVTGISTKFGESDAVDADVVILDGEEKGERLDNVRIFQGALIGVLKGRIGKQVGMVLGRLGTVPNKKDTEGKPVWVLEQPTEDDKQVARDYLAAATKPKDPFA